MSGDTNTGTHTAADGLGPFEALREMDYDAPFPTLVPVQQKFDAPQVQDVTAATAAALEPLRNRLQTGMTVAITAGSRGIHDKPAVVRATGEWLRSVGVEPFVVPAMGSHGGATAEGQVQLLADLGMTEASLGMSIRATMDTVELGRVADGPAVHLDAVAAQADGIIAVNRIKAHTDFKGDVESGLAKIVGIGLGKRLGAEGVHRYGPANLAVWIPRVAERIIDTGKILGGLGIVENAYDRAAKIAWLEPSDIAGPGESALLDVAVVDVMGKNKSGSGLDTNVIGRLMIRGSEEFDRPRIRNIAVLDLSEQSHGNAVGLGLADFIPLSLLEKVDLRTMYINAMTSGLGGPQRAQIPMTMPTERSAIAAAILTCGRADLENARVVRMHSTLDLEMLLVSESLRGEVESSDRLAVAGDPVPMTFDAQGRLEGPALAP